MNGLVCPEVHRHDGVLKESSADEDLKYQALAAYPVVLPVGELVGSDVESILRGHFLLHIAEGILVIDGLTRIGADLRNGEADAYITTVRRNTDGLAEALLIHFYILAVGIGWHIASQLVTFAAYRKLCGHPRLDVADAPVDSLKRIPNSCPPSGIT